jgi:hypothetical protein
MDRQGAIGLFAPMEGHSGIVAEGTKFAQRRSALITIHCFWTQIPKHLFLAGIEKQLSDKWFLRTICTPLRVSSW